jgi:hypothetical protein
MVYLRDAGQGKFMSERTERERKNCLKKYNGVNVNPEILIIQ